MKNVIKMCLYLSCFGVGICFGSDVFFSPNGDGINDVIGFKAKDAPISIYCRRGEKNILVKKITEKDNFQWDGKKDDNSFCEAGSYIAKTGNDKDINILLIR